MQLKLQQAVVKERFKVKVFINSGGSTAFRVQGVGRDGKFIRENYADLKQAQCRQTQLSVECLEMVTDTQVRATKLTDTQLRLAEAAFYKLNADEEIILAIDYWLAHGRAQAVQTDVKIDDAVQEFNKWLVATESLRERTKANLRTRIAVFGNSVANVNLSSVTPEFVEAFLSGRRVSASTKDNDRRAISRFCSWCMERPRKWLASNPCSTVKVEQGEAEVPEILTVDECERLMRSAEGFKEGKLVPYMAVCLFAGLRPFEAARLKWKQVNLTDGEIRLEGWQTKTGKGRVVSITPVMGHGAAHKAQDTLFRWLTAYQGKPFCGPNWRNDFDAVRERAGFVTQGRLDELKKAGRDTTALRVWVEDVLRHTSISFYFRLTGSYGLAAEYFGNSEAIIKAHYAGRVSTEDTAKFYSIKPTIKGAL